VRRTGPITTIAGGAQAVAPEDAPVLLVSSRPGEIWPKTDASEGPDAIDPKDPLAATTRNLQGYQRQLQGLMDNMTRSTALVTGQAGTAGATTTGLQSPTFGSQGTAQAAGGGLFGGQLQASATPRVVAGMLGNRSLTLPTGTAFTCALKTRIVSNTSGFVGCQVQRDLYSDNGRVLLVERGSHLDGEYRVTSVRPGTVRIPVLWTRLRTPQGVTVDLDSPGTGSLGESGIDGQVDNRWGERIGAALLLSLIDDAVKIVVQDANSAGNAGSSTTVVLPTTTANASKLAEKVLDSTINIPPTIVRDQGGIVGVVVARDVDFSSVYALRPTARQTGTAP
jgi:type IV secretion system protein VirB10